MITLSHHHTPSPLRRRLQLMDEIIELGEMRLELFRLINNIQEAIDAERKRKIAILMQVPQPCYAHVMNRSKSVFRSLQGQPAVEVTNEGVDAAGLAIGTSSEAVFKLKKVLNPKQVQLN
ncbi:unnamed protein product [Vicia faba]|uniref:Uncharacterized protein n=1 Tax=Vicia faba TaxID=3906 RepID=A0AAV0ZIH1_VICFA|nr:unnamed protein product [Vicia faba]